MSISGHTWKYCYDQSCSHVQNINKTLSTNGWHHIFPINCKTYNFNHFKLLFQENSVSSLGTIILNFTKKKGFYTFSKFWFSLITHDIFHIEKMLGSGLICTQLTDAPTNDVQNQTLVTLNGSFGIRLLFEAFSF